MAQHAKILERRITDKGSILRAELSDDTAGVLGTTEVADGPINAVKAALRQEAQRLLALPVGTVLDL